MRFVFTGRCLAVLVQLSIALLVSSCGSDHESYEDIDADERSYQYDPMRPDYTLPDDYIASGFEFRKGSTAIAGLTHKVHDQYIKLCLSDATNSQSRREIVVESVLKWVKALQPITDKPLVNDVQISSWNSSGCDVYVSYGNYRPANTNMGRTPRVNIANSGWFGSDTVILHEFGHAFGLLDTYNGSGGSCQSGQPSSVMCYAKFTDLKLDDIQGVQSLYRDIHN
jgi:hypothetical protein